VTVAVPAALLARIREAPGPIVFLTGAGISAESGIPTFRGPEGYWRVGSKNYHPMEMATAAAFARMPEEVWAWYLSRRARCLAHKPAGADVRDGRGPRRPAAGHRPG
jgi:NAD-dependent deacetylase